MSEMNYRGCMRPTEWCRGLGARTKLWLTVASATTLSRIRGRISPQAFRQSTKVVRVVCVALAVFATALSVIRSGAAALPGAEEVSS